MDSVAACPRCGRKTLPRVVAPAAELCQACRAEFIRSWTIMATYDRTPRWERIVYTRINGDDFAGTRAWRGYTWEALGLKGQIVERDVGDRQEQRMVRGEVLQGIPTPARPATLLDIDEPGCVVQVWEQRARWRDSSLYVVGLWRPWSGEEYFLGGVVLTAKPPKELGRVWRGFGLFDVIKRNRDGRPNRPATLTDEERATLARYDELKNSEQYKNTSDVHLARHHLGVPYRRLRYLFDLRKQLDE